MSKSRIAACALVCLVAGCSRTELVYDNIHWLAHRWASRMVDADRTQREAWREPFRRVVADHREALLPEIISLLRSLEREIAQGVSADVLHCLIEVGDRVYREHARMAVPLATMVLLDLSSPQVTHLAEALQERNLEFRDNYLQDDPTVREQERLERLIERIERWTGRLDSHQMVIVENGLKHIPNATEDWLAYRQEQQARLIALLTAGADRNTLQRFLGDWWIERYDQSPDLQDKFKRIREASIALVLALDEALQATQRAKLVNNIAELRRQLEGLVETPASPSLAHQRSACALG